MSRSNAHWPYTMRNVAIDMRVVQKLLFAALSCIALASPVLAGSASLGVTLRAASQETDAGSLVQLAQDTALDFSVSDASGPAGEPLPLEIALPDGFDVQSGLAMIRGLPEPVSLNAGFRTGGTWMVSLKELGDLAVTAPDTYEGAFDVEVVLVVGESRNRESRTASIAIDGEAASTAAEDAGGQVTSATPAERPPEQAPPQPAPEAQDEPQPAISAAAERGMIEQAARLLANGDVSSARLVYEHLASKGSAIGALSLARTYDPRILPSLGVIGMQPDPERARKWYERAIALGSEAAREQLATLTAVR